MMPLEAKLSRYVFSGAYERMARMAAMLCRLGVLLAVVQLGAWGVNAWLQSTDTSARQSAMLQQRMAAVESVVTPSVAVLVRTGGSSDLDGVGTLEWSLNAIRDTTRSLLWGIAIILLPVALTVGMLSPFVRGVDATRVLFGMIAVLGLLPLASAEAAPTLGGVGAFPAIPSSMLAGVAAPAVAAVLLAAAAVLLTPRSAFALGDGLRGNAPRISSKELESIIRRGEHPTPGGVRSNRYRRTTQ